MTLKSGMLTTGVTPDLECGLLAFLAGLTTLVPPPSLNWGGFYSSIWVFPGVSKHGDHAVGSSCDNSFRLEMFIATVAQW